MTPPSNDTKPTADDAKIEKSHAASDVGDEAKDEDDAASEASDAASEASDDASEDEASDEPATDEPATDEPAATKAATKAATTQPTAPAKAAAAAKAPVPPSNPVVVTAVTGGLVAVILIALFWFASEPTYRSQALPSFLAMIVIVTGALIAATASPRLTAHGLAALFGTASLLAGVGSLDGGIPFLLALVLIAMGAGSLGLTVQSYRRRSRPAWAFLAAILGVMAVCTLFGAPKIRNLLGVTMWISLMIPGLLTVACSAFGMIAEEYRERGVVPKR